MTELQYKQNSRDIIRSVKAVLVNMVRALMT